MKGQYDVNIKELEPKLIALLEEADKLCLQKLEKYKRYKKKVSKIKFQQVLDRFNQANKMKRLYTSLPEGGDVDKYAELILFLLAVESDFKKQTEFVGKVQSMQEQLKRVCANNDIIFEVVQQIVEGNETVYPTMQWVIDEYVNSLASQCAQIEDKTGIAQKFYDLLLKIYKTMDDLPVRAIDYCAATSTLKEMTSSVINACKESNVLGLVVEIATSMVSSVAHDTMYIHDLSTDLIIAKEDSNAEKRQSIKPSM